MQNNLKSIRKAAGLTLDELAIAIGSSKGHVWEMEQPESNPTLGTAYKVASVLGKQVTDIWSDTTE